MGHNLHQYVLVSKLKRRKIKRQVGLAILSMVLPVDNANKDQKMKFSNSKIENKFGTIFNTPVSLTGQVIEHP